MWKEVFPLAPPGNLFSVADQCPKASAGPSRNSVPSFPRLTTTHAILPLVKASLRGEKKKVKKKIFFFKVGRNQHQTEQNHTPRFSYLGTELNHQSLYKQDLACFQWGRSFSILYLVEKFHLGPDLWRSFRSLPSASFLELQSYAICTPYSFLLQLDLTRGSLFTAHF